MSSKTVRILDRENTKRHRGNRKGLIKDQLHSRTKGGVIRLWKTVPLNRRGQGFKKHGEINPQSKEGKTDRQGSGRIQGTTEAVVQGNGGKKKWGLGIPGGKSGGQEPKRLRAGLNQSEEVLRAVKVRLKGGLGWTEWLDAQGRAGEQKRPLAAKHLQAPDGRGSLVERGGGQNQNRCLFLRAITPTA